MAVLCGHCHRKHATSYDVYLCSRNARGSFRRPEPQAQVAAPVRPSRPRFDPYVYPLKAPQAMVESIRDGRYAVDVGTMSGGEQRVIFVRISRPTRGKLAGALKIQTQHSDYYKEALIKYPSGQWRLYTQRTTELDQALTMICVNPLDAAMLYAKELDACSRCGRELTDERSRYYSIGPECEKHWPDLITKINNTKGPF